MIFERGLVTLVLVSVGCGPVVMTSEGEGSDGATTGRATSASPPASTGAADSAGAVTTSGVVTTGPAGTATTVADSSSTLEDTWIGDDGFIMDPDVSVDPGDCTVAAQNCRGGFKCVWFSVQGGPRRDNAQCIPVEGDLEPFEPCTLPNGIGQDITDDCGADSYCLDVYGTVAHGFCAPFSVGGDCDAYPGTIPVFENGSDFPAACLLHPCHPLQQGACEDGMRCMFYPASLYAQAMCWVDPEPEPDPLGTPCDFGTCGEGQLCAASEWLPDCDADRCCAQWCEFPGGTCDGPGTTCEFLPLWNYAAETYEDVGACLVPGALE